MVEYMERHDLFNPSQHGFRHGRPCLSQRIVHYDHILATGMRGKSQNCELELSLEYIVHIIPLFNLSIAFNITKHGGTALVCPTKTIACGIMMDGRFRV